MDGGKRSRGPGRALTGQSRDPPSSTGHLSDNERLRFFSPVKSGGSGSLRGYCEEELR